MPTFLLYCSFWHSALAEVVVRTNFEFIALFCRGQNYKFCVYLRPSLGRGLTTLCCSMLTPQCAQNKGKNSAMINNKYAHNHLTTKSKMNIFEKNFFFPKTKPWFELLNWTICQYVDDVKMKLILPTSIIERFVKYHIELEWNVRNFRSISFMNWKSVSKL